MVIVYAKLLQSCPTPCNAMDSSLSVSQFPLSIGSSRQEYWSGSPCPPPRDLPNLGTEPTFLVSAVAGRFYTTNAT